MKKFILCLIFCTSFITVYANTYAPVQLGISLAAGGRYDEVRMCVASPAGVKGGPAFEFAGFAFEGRIHEYFGLGLYIPLARPILFGAAFGMHQFLPEAVISLHIPVVKKVELSVDFGLGASLHYGPDYTSGNNTGDPMSPAFFAAGPRVSVFNGIIYYLNDFIAIKAGIRPYFEYLISDYLSGKVIGAEIDFQVRFLLKGKK